MGEIPPYIGRWLRLFTAVWRTLPQLYKVLPPDWCCNWVFNRWFHCTIKPDVECGKTSEFHEQVAFAVNLAFWLRSSGGSDGKHLSPMWKTWVRSLGWEVLWRRKWQPTPILLPRKSHGRRSLVSMGSQRVGHDWATSLHWYTFRFSSCILDAFKCTFNIIWY